MAIVVLVFCLPLRVFAEPISPKPNQTLPQEPHWQLFLDDHVIARSTGFQRVLHRPQPRGIVLEGDNRWEQTGVTPLYVGKQRDGRYEMYYRGHGAMGAVTAYAVSEDGILWEKPTLNLVDSPWGKENNLAPCSQLWDL